MEQYIADPWRARALATAAVDRAAQELHDIVKALAASLAPFPGFMGLATLQAVEVEPGRSANPDNGCIVVAPDGELYELILRAIPGPPETGGTDQVEELKELELDSKDYVPLAFQAIQELTRIHGERLQTSSS